MTRVDFETKVDRVKIKNICDRYELLIKWFCLI